jgi:hypothetical protein
MDAKLTSNYQCSHHDKDGCDRNYISFYLNDILILRQKIPFDTNLEKGFDRNTLISDVYLLNGKLFQKRYNSKSGVREISFPVSKKILSQFDIPQDFKITLS